MLLILVSCTSSKPHQPEIKYAFDGKTLSVKVQLPEGLHAYGPGEPVGRPVKLVIHPTNHWSLSSAPHIPAGDSNHMLSHAFEIKAQLKDGHGPVVGTFKMQLCSNTSCERPQDYAFQVGL